MKPLHKDKSKGFTMVEMLVSMGIAMVVLAAVTSTFMAQTKFYNAQEQVNEMQQNARAAIDLMSREIKMAGYDPTGLAITTSNGIPYDASQLQLLADLDDDTFTTGTNENISYSYDASNLRIQRTTGGTTTTLAENISGFTFVYLDASGNSTTTTANVRQIQITITARTSKPDPNYTANAGYRTYQLTALITPKNLCYKGGSCP
jgi:type IV pilus assembly protein PilW